MKNLFLYVYSPLIFFLLFIAFFHSITAINQDLGRHILTGKLILHEFSVPKVNLYSYTYPDFPFINHHYLSEVIFYIIQSSLGFSWLLLIMSLIALCSFLLIYIFSVKRFGYFVPALLSLFYLPVLFERTDLRPEIFSFLFLSLFVVILYLNRESKTKLIFLLIPFQLLWTQMHIYFFIGPFVIFLFLLEMLIAKRKKILHSSLLIVFLLSCLTMIFNPNGLNGALYPLQVFNNYGYAIEENQTVFFLYSLGFNKPSFPFFLLSVFTLAIALIASKKSFRLIDLLLGLSFSIFAFIAVRNFPLFVLATFIPTCYGLAILKRSLSRLHLLGALQKRFYFKVVVNCLMFLLLIWEYSNVISSRNVGSTLPNEVGAAVNYFEKENLQGPIFNNFDIGSYLSYRLYPRERVFIDGRPEAYPADFIQKTYIPMQQDPDNFSKADAKYKFSTIIFSHTDQTPWAATFLQNILNNKDWTTVYLNDTVVILTRRAMPGGDYDSEQSLLIPPLSKAEYDKKSLQSLLRMGQFYSRYGSSTDSAQIYREILSLDPKNCQVLTLILSTPSILNDVYQQSYRRHCR